MNCKTLLIAALFVAAAGMASAQEKAGPCKADVEKFCKDVKPGGGRLVACLKAHEAELSAECKAKGDMLKARVDGIREACGEDMDKFCKDVKGGRGEKLRCMKEHEKELSEKCKAKIASEKQEMGKKNPCLPDIEKFCKDVKPGEGRIIACVKAHEAELSGACKADVAAKKEELKKNNPCAADTEKFCKDVKPGEGRIIACLKAHEAELSEACKARAEKGGKHGGEHGKRGGPGGPKGGPGGDKPEAPAQPPAEGK